MQPLVKGHRPRRLSNDPVSVAEYAALDIAEMRCQFAGGPASRLRLLQPLRRGNGVGGLQKLRLGTRQLLQNGLDFVHGVA